MQRFIRPLLGAAVVLSSLACADNVTDSSNSDINLSAAFSTLPTGYAQVLSSYAGGEGPLAFSYGGDGGRHGPGGHRDGLAAFSWAAVSTGCSWAASGSAIMGAADSVTGRLAMVRSTARAHSTRHRVV
jgi:hypothetical protein